MSPRAWCQLPCITCYSLEHTTSAFAPFRPCSRARGGTVTHWACDAFVPSRSPVFTALSLCDYLLLYSGLAASLYMWAPVPAAVFLSLH